MSIKISKKVTKNFRKNIKIQNINLKAKMKNRKNALQSREAVVK